MSALVLLAAAAPADPGGLDILRDLALIMCVAAVTTVVFQRLRQPVVLGYLLAGVIVGPHLPIPLFANEQVAHTLSELGVILLMFSLGLEFSLRKLARVGGTAGIVAVIQCSLMIWLGYVTGRAFGWTTYDSLFTGALVAISSTTIIVKAFGEQKITGPVADIVFGVLIVEDLIAIILLAVLTAVASGAGLSFGGLALTVGRLGGFLAAMLVIGMLTVPRFVRLVARLGRKETTIVAGVGVCFGFALLARTFGYSVALGAFVGGALVAESGEGKAIEHLIEPVRDVFAAVFFVSVGMLIDPVLVARNWPAVLVLTAVVVVGKLVGVGIGAFIAGHGVRMSVQAGMSLAQIGEFSFIIAGVGAALGVTGHFLYPVAVAVSALTTLLTPWLIRASGGMASRVDRSLPRALQTYAALYGSWVEQLRSTNSGRRTAWSRIRRMLALMFVDVAAIAAVVIGASLVMPRVVRFAGETFGLGASLTRLLTVAAAVAVLVPFVLGAVRIARALGAALAAEALPSEGRQVDLAAAPRRALLVTIQIGLLLIVGIPLVAVTQPFLPSVPGFALLLLGAIALIVPLWRSAANLHGHVRAGAEVLLERLAAQSWDPDAQPHQEVRSLLPGIGATAAVVLAPDAPAVGRSLGQIGLRGLSGATAIAIQRGVDHVVYPSADEVLRAGDTLLLTGTSAAVATATAILTGNPEAPAAPPPP